MTTKPSSNEHRMKTESSSAVPVVFVVDDDASLRGAVTNLIRSVGLRVEAFASTTEFFAAKRPDATCCLILDVRLPGVSGLDFQAELARAKIQIPIIFITGHGDIPMTVKAMKAGAVEFLTKPFRDQDLLDAVQAGLDRDRARRDRAARRRRRARPRRNRRSGAPSTRSRFGRRPPRTSIRGNGP